MLSKRTNLSTEEVMQRAKDFFENRLGLEIRNESSDCCIEFVSNLGFVTVQAIEDDQGREVKLTTREYEYQIQEFLREF
ncbi:MAG: hypothetical protein ACFFER_01435 [Candidatus Thorarchaeota archaeon]